MARQKSDEQLERGGGKDASSGDERPRVPDPDAEPGSAGGDVHAAGAGGGGYAIGGLRGSNEGDGGPKIDELEEAAGSGTFDLELDAEDQPPYAGQSGGAVGGAPAEKRAAGGHSRRGVAAGDSHRGDSTIGSNSPARKKKG